MQNKRNYLKIETLAAFALLLIFGVTTLMLITATGRAYNMIKSSGDASSRIRIASSYIAMRVRQADVKGAIHLKANPVNNADALVIDSKLNGSSYETWIFYSEGALREVFLPKGTKLDMSTAGEIVQLDALAFRKTLNNKGIEVNMSAGYSVPVKYIKYDMLLHLRAWK
jgi:hypothetical protein